jgi:predicted transcriptional regulator
MQQLTNAEEQLMEHLWKLEKAFMKDLLKHLVFTKKND